MHTRGTYCLPNFYLSTVSIATLFALWRVKLHHCKLVKYFTTYIYSLANFHKEPFIYKIWATFLKNEIHEVQYGLPQYNNDVLSSVA